MCGVFYIGKYYLQKFLQLLSAKISAKCQSSSGVEECHYCYVAVINIGCLRGMSLANVIAASFTSTHAEDHYPRYADGDCTGSVETWMTLFKRDGSVTTAAVSKASRTGTLSEAFHMWLGRSSGSGYIKELKARGLDNIPWMKMVEFKFACK
jgi:hypothetical protein